MRVWRFITQKTQQGVKSGVGVRRTTGNKEIDRQVCRRAFRPLIRLEALILAKQAPGYGASANSDNWPGRGHGVVAFEQGFTHVARYRPGQRDGVGMARGGYKVHAKAADVKNDCGQHIKVGFTCPATGGCNLAQLERTGEAPGRARLDWQLGQEKAPRVAGV